MSEEELVERRARGLRAGSRTLSELLERDDAMRRLLADQVLPDRAGYEAIIQRAYDEGAMEAVRLAKRRRLAQIAAWDLAGEALVEVVGRALSDLADACLAVSVRAVEGGAGLAILAMGKLGGRELNYVSDIDLVFVADGDLPAATRAAEQLLRDLGEASPQ